jgi:hypothetical protein
MTTVFDTYAADASSHFKSAFGQTITVYPDGATTREVEAIVSYESGASSNVPAAPRGTSKKITITVDNDATTGLSAAEFNSALATALLPKTQGADPSTVKIVGILEQDAAFVTYEVR